MSYDILSLMNKQSNSTIPLYSNVNKPSPDNSHNIPSRYPEPHHGTLFQSQQESKIINSVPHMSNIMRYIEQDFPIEEYSFDDEDDEDNILSINSMSPLTDTQPNTPYNGDPVGRGLSRKITGVSESFSLLNSPQEEISNKVESERSNSVVPMIVSEPKSGSFEQFDITQTDNKQHRNKIIKANCACGKCRDKSFLMHDPYETHLENLSMGTAETLDPILRKRVAEYRPRNHPKQVNDITSSQKSQDINSVNFKSSNERNKLSKDIGYEQQRIYDIMNMRMKVAKKHGNGVPLMRPIIFQEKYVNTYSKGLPHDEEGFVNKDEMMKLIIALEERDSQKLSKIKLGGKLKLVNPSAAWSSDIIGACNNTYRYSKLPGLSSDFIASEMSELYCMSLARDIPFSQYKNSSIIEDCCGYLNKLKKYPQVDGKVTPYNIFRGPMYSDLQGPYISQFLYRDLRMGGFMQKQKYTTDLEGYDFMKTWETALSAQNGNIMESPPPIRSKPRYIITGRDLACYVHSDEPYQAFYHACVLLMDIKAPMNPGFIKLMNDNPVESFFVDIGKADIQAITNIIGRNALLAAWYVKWNSLFLRPEALAIEVERVYRSNKNTYRISPELLRNPVLEAIRSRNGNVLLSQAYPEGAPLHPSTPSGHAALAGACVTVLKFFFDTKYELDVYEPDENGAELIKTGMKTTVGDELNKLASNMAIGRNWSGVHYHMDAISGLKRGEKVAISCLEDMMQRYPHELIISIPKFNGHIVTLKK